MVHLFLKQKISAGNLVQWHKWLPGKHEIMRSISITKTKNPENIFRHFLDIYFKDI